MRKIVITFLFAAIVLYGKNCYSQDKIFKTGLNICSLKHEDIDRDFIIYLPIGFTTGKKYPVMFSFHGGGGTKEKMAEKWFTDYLNKYNWIGIMPQGLLKSWNSEDHEGFVNRMSSADDIGFVKKIVDYLKKNFDINDRRIYAYGRSNGAVMNYTLARKTGIFAAIISLSGALIEVQELLPDTEQLTVIHIHGKDDIHVPYKGGVSETLKISFKPVQETIRIWARHNGSNKEKIIEKCSEYITVYRYPECKNGTEVILYLLADTPHNVTPRVKELKLFDEIFERVAGKSKPLSKL